MAWLLLCLVGAVLRADEKVTYDDHVKPLFQERCASCHNGDKQSGGLDLTNFTNMMQGGGSGDSIEAGDAEGSYLYQLITHQETPEMPPGNNKLPEQDIKLVESWINGGALENKGSVAKKKKAVVSSSGAIGVRPEVVAMPPRLSREPVFRSQRKGVATSLAASPWSAVVAAAGPRQVLLYEGKRMRYSGSLPFPEGQATTVRFSANGAILIAGGGRHGVSGKIVGWDVATCNRVFEIGDEFDNVLAADISPDHQLAALGGPQKMLRVYSTETEALSYELKKHSDWITQIAFSPDGVLLASADRSGGLHLWEAETGNEYLTLAGHDGPITGLSWRADGNMLASCSKDGNVKLWEVVNGAQTKNWAAHKGGVTGIGFTRQGKLVSCGRDKLVKLWKQDGKIVRQFEGSPDIGVAVAFCDETQQAICSSLTGEVNVWSASDSKPNRKININPPTLSQQITVAAEQLKSLQAELKPVEAEFKKANANFIARTLQTKQLESHTEATEQFIKAKREESEQLASKSNSAAAQREKWEAKIESLNSALPTVKAAWDKAREAAELLPKNESLQHSAEELGDEFTALQNQTVDLARQVTESYDAAESADKITDLVKKQIEQQLKTKRDLAKQLEEIQSLLEPAREQKQKLEPQLLTARKNVEQAKLRLEEWRAELAFHDELVAKNRDLAEARETVASHDAVLTEAESRLKQAQGDFDKQLDQNKNLQKAVEQIESSIRELQQRK